LGHNYYSPLFLKLFNLCDRIAIMNEGKIEQIGTAEEIYEHPSTRFVADFIGDTNFVEGTVVDRDGRISAIDSNGLSFWAGDEGQFNIGDPVTLCLRPEGILIGEAAKGCDTIHTARIINIIYSGASRRCMVELPNRTRLKADLDARATADFHVGEKTSVGWYAGDGTLLGS